MTDQDSGQTPPPTEEPPSGHAAVDLLRAIPAIGALPGPAVALIGLGIVAFAGMILIEALSLFMALVFHGLGSLLTVLLLAMISAYLLDPAIDRLENRGWGRTLAICSCLAAFLLCTGVLLLLLIPYVVTEVSDLSENIDTYILDLGQRLADLELLLQEKTGRELDLRFASLAEELPRLVQQLGTDTDGAGPIASAMGWLTRFFGGAIGLVVTWALFPIFAFFLLRDFDILKTRAFELLPHRWRQAALDHYTGIDQKMAAFVRGQFVLCCTLALLYALGLGVFTNIDLAVLIGLVSGLLFVIPYLGTIIGVSAGTVLAVLKFGASMEVVKVWAVFGVVQLLEGTLLTPKIVGSSVGLHPVVVILALAVGANLFGFLGILLAVPAAAALQVLLASWVGRYKATDWFQEGQEDSPGSEEIL
jgi:predicted PurR-regulated permease PerM